MAGKMIDGARVAAALSFSPGIIPLNRSHFLYLLLLLSRSFSLFSFIVDINRPQNGFYDCLARCIFFLFNHCARLCATSRALAQPT